LSRAIGFAAEDLASRYLLEHGFLLLERNFTTKFGEIDIIAKKDGILHFIEVKYSKKYDPLERITPAKLAKLYKTIDLYLLQKELDLPYQLDALIIQDEAIDFIENITF